MSSTSQALFDHYRDIGHPVAEAARLAKVELAKREEIAKKNRADSKAESMSRRAQ